MNRPDLSAVNILDIPIDIGCSVSVIIPVYKDLLFLNKCLEAIEISKAECADIVEVIVVDDGSPNSTEIELLVKKYKFTYFKLAKNSGPAKARNVGVSLSNGEILFFVDADVVVKKDCIAQVCSFFSSGHHSYSAMIGSYVKEVDSKDFLSNYKNLNHHYVHQSSNEDTFNFWTGCGAVRRDAFLAVNGFDVSYTGALIEDVEFGYRLKEKGYSIFINKGLQVKHLKQYVFKTLLVSDLFYRAIPLTKLMLKHKKISNDQDTKINALLSTALVFGLIPASIFVYYLSNVFLLSGLLLSFLVVFAMLNFNYLRFLFREKGLLFGVKSYFYLFLYYSYCGLGFIIGTASYRMNGNKKDEYEVCAN